MNSHSTAFPSKLSRTLGCVCGIMERMAADEALEGGHRDKTFSGLRAVTSARRPAVDFLKSQELLDRRASYWVRS
jgi:hypothetical protein